MNTAICLVIVIIALLLFWTWLNRNQHSEETRYPQFPNSDETHAIGLVEVPKLKHCFHPEDGTPEQQICCYCGQSRMSLRPLSGHGEEFTVLTDINNEDCFRRTWLANYL